MEQTARRRPPLVAAARTSWYTKVDDTGLALAPGTNAMRDPFSWSFPIGYLFGTSVRVHILFPLVAIGLIWRAGATEGVHPGTWIDAAMLMGLLFFAVLLHEFGHIFAARHVEGEANELLLWPLGGLARVDVPHTARANLITALGGPAANVVLCLACALGLAFLADHSFRPPFNPFWYPYRWSPAGEVELLTWAGEAVRTDGLVALLLSRLFFVSWILLLLNVLLVGLPLDGGRVLQCVLWPYVGYRQATLYAIYAGFGCMFVVLLAALFFNEILPVFLAGYIYVSCKQEWIMLEMGAEDSLFGYDFSQGYTSLERDEPAPTPRPRKKKQNFIQRWLQRRAARRAQQEMEQQIAEERRMDELLDKIQRYGKESLTDEEQRFLQRVSDRYKNKS